MWDKNRDLRKFLFYMKMSNERLIYRVKVLQCIYIVFKRLLYVRFSGSTVLFLNPFQKFIVRLAAINNVFNYWETGQ